MSDDLKQPNPLKNVPSVTTDGTGGRINESRHASCTNAYHLAYIAELEAHAASYEHRLDCETCLRMGDEHRALVDKADELKAQLVESNEVCVCGCPPDQHENYGEDGEGCEDDSHECVRTCIAVRDMMQAERKQNAALKAQEKQLRAQAVEIERLNKKYQEHTADLEKTVSECALGKFRAEEEIASLRKALIQINEWSTIGNSPERILRDVQLFAAEQALAATKAG